MNMNAKRFTMKGSTILENENEQLKEENNKVMNQTDKLLNAIAVIQILTIIGMIILILMN